MTTTQPGISRWNPHKEKYVYPCLEDFHPLTFYALTINPNDLIHSESDQVTEVVNAVFADILPFFYKAEYVLRPEISTKSNLLHYHGTIMFSERDDITKFYWYIIRKLKTVCTFTIKPIADQNDWHVYVIKQRLHMKPFMQSMNLRYRITNSHKSPYVKTKQQKVYMDPLDPEKGKTTTPIIISSLLK